LNSWMYLLEFFRAFCSFSKLLRSRPFDRFVIRSISTTRRRFSSVVLILVFVLEASTVEASTQETVFKIPPVKIPLDIKDQPITITTSAVLTISSKDRNGAIVNLELTGDLSDLQQNLTGLLSSQLNKDDHCGERIAIQNTSIAPAEPASVALIQLHFERWECVKLLGRQAAKKLIGGDAQIQIKLTPSIDEGGTGLRLVPEVGEIHADGSLGELLRSGMLGGTIREKIQNAMLSALQKAANMDETLPPAVRSYVTIRNAKFKDAADGRLLVVLDGEARVTQEQVRLLSNQVKERLASR
jgi:hypothetical protein